MNCNKELKVSTLQYVCNVVTCHHPFRLQHDDAQPNDDRVWVQLD